MSRGPIPDKPADRPTVPEVAEAIRELTTTQRRKLSDGFYG